VVLRLFGLTVPCSVAVVVLTGLAAPVTTIGLVDADATTPTHCQVVAPERVQVAVAVPPPAATCHARSASFDHDHIHPLVPFKSVQGDVGAAVIVPAHEVAVTAATTRFPEETLWPREGEAVEPEDEAKTKEDAPVTSNAEAYQVDASVIVTAVEGMAPPAVTSPCHTSVS
jgi:hypothetical protein